MVTALISQSYVNHAGAWLAGWFVCSLVYMIVCFMFKTNRRNVKHVLFSFLLMEFVVDVAWALIYYGPDGYINQGLSSVLGLLLWPAALIISGVIVTVNGKSHRD
ncbi:MAG: hypothetical protein LUJ09_00445 [Firmicutes bacterium]|nr:hypothetical protein [Bacillota bacterium]